MTARARFALALIALLALIAVAYAPATRGVLIGDDHALVNASRAVRRGSFLENIRAAFWAPPPVRDARAAYQPLVVLSLRLDAAFAGGGATRPFESIALQSVGAFHTTSLVLHLVTTIALALVARRFGASTPAALIGAAGWALHPRITESVAWISGRADVLAALLAITAIGVWPWYAGAARGGRLRACIAGMAVFLGLLAKETALAAVVAVLAGTWLGATGTRRERAREVMPRLAYVLVPAAGYVVLRWLATRHVSGVGAPIASASGGATVLEAIARYAEMAVDPWHPATSIGLGGDLDRARAALGGVILLIGAALLAWRLARRLRANCLNEPLNANRSSGVSVAAAVALGTSALAVVIVQICPVAVGSSVAADHLLSLPLAGLTLALAAAAGELSPRRRRLAAGVALVLTASFVPVTRARAGDYADELLFRVVAAEHAHPHDISAKSALGNDLRAAGDTELACRLHASASRSLAPLGASASTRRVRALENLGGCYAILGAYERAAEAYAQALALSPDNGRLHMQIGLLRLHTFALDDAEVSLRRALALDATLDLARRSLATLPETRAGLAAMPTAEARRANRAGWALLLLALGRVPDATKAWLEIVLDPTSLLKDAADGLVFLMAYADVMTASRASEAYFERGGQTDLRFERFRLSRRLVHQAKIDMLRPRLEALAAD